MNLLNRLQEIIDSANKLTLNSYISADDKDLLECPCCLETYEYNSDLSINNIKHDEKCLYNLVMKLEETLNNSEDVKIALNDFVEME